MMSGWLRSREVISGQQNRPTELRKGTQCGQVIIARNTRGVPGL